MTAARAPGAWPAAVYAAAAAPVEARQQRRFAKSPVLDGDEHDVAGWKKALVGICPLH